MSFDAFMSAMLKNDVIRELSGSTDSLKDFLKSQIGKVRKPSDLKDIPITNLFRCVYYNSYEKTAKWGSEEKQVTAKDIIFYADDVLYSTHYVGKEIFEVGQVYKLKFSPIEIKEKTKDKPDMMIVSRIRLQK